MSARSRIGFRGAALEPQHAPPQRHRDRCAGLPTVRTYSRRDRRGSAEHQRVADFTARRAASGRSGPVRHHQLGPVLADYLWRYPEVVVDVTLDDGFIDLVEEGFDLALRVGELKDSSLVAPRCAGSVRALRLSRLCQATWRAARAGRSLTASAPSPANGVSRARLRSNNGNMLHAAMLAGAGIGFVPTFVAGRNLAEGRLISLMPDYQPVESELSVIYPPGKNLSAIRSIAIEQVSHSRPFE